MCNTEIQKDGVRGIFGYRDYFQVSPSKVFPVLMQRDLFCFLVMILVWIQILQPLKTLHIWEIFILCQATAANKLSTSRTKTQSACAQMLWT